MQWRQYYIGHAIGSLLAMLSLIWFIRQVLQFSDDLFEIIIPGMNVIVYNTGLYSLSLFLSGFIWYVLMLAVGEHKLGVIRAVAIVFISQIGKYAPGNIAHHIGRVLLVKKYGVSISSTLFTMLLEVMFSIAISGLFALVAVLIMGDSIFGNITHMGAPGTVAMFAVAVVLVPFAAHKVFLMVGKRWAKIKGIEYRKIRFPSMPILSFVSLLYIINYVFLGFVIELIAVHLFAMDTAGIFLLAGIYTVAWIVGFVTPGAPAGLGVRELVLVASLTPVYGHDVAVGMAVSIRMVTTLGDGLAFVIGLIISIFQRPARTM